MTDSERLVLAVPSNGDGGLDAERSGHFGHADCFTIVEIEDGAVVASRVLANLAHVEGGCLRPVDLLASNGVNAIVVAGIGGRPLAGFNDAGIAVYFDNTLPVVRDAVDGLIAGRVELIDPSYSCGHHH